MWGYQDVADRWYLGGHHRGKGRLNKFNTVYIKPPPYADVGVINMALVVISLISFSITAISSAKTKVIKSVNPLTAKLFNWNFHLLEVVSRWRDAQLQVSEHYSDLTKMEVSSF